MTTNTTHILQPYHSMCRDILENGRLSDDRTGVGTLSVFGRQYRYDLSKGEFPLVSAKHVSFKLVASELLWFIKGDTNIKYLLQHDNHIWTEWAFKNYMQSAEYIGVLTVDDLNIEDENKRKILKEEMIAFEQRILSDKDFCLRYGDLGSVYGRQWRGWETTEGSIDQLAEVINEIKKNSNSRRLIVSAWNAGEVHKMALPPCHCFFQFNVRGEYLDCQLYQRSADTFLGVPFNIASYSLLTILIARECGLKAGEFIHAIGDGHIYKNHIEQVERMLNNGENPAPTLVIDTDKGIFDLTVDDIKLNNYESKEVIKGVVAV